MSIAAAIRCGLAAALCGSISARAAEGDLVDIPAFIECRVRDVTAYQRFASRLGDDEKGVSRPLGWSEEPSKNLALKQFRLAKPITVFGRQTRQIAFTASGLLAVLADADPHPIAHELGVQPMLDTRSKFLGEKVVFERKDKDGGVTFHNKIVLNVSTVDSHPGKTLAGCTYSIEVE